MRLDDVQESENVEDRRGTGGGFGGGMRGFAFRPAGLGIGGVLVLVVISYFLGIDPMSLLSGDPTAVGGEPTAGAPNAPAGSDAEAIFSRKVLRDTEDTWTAIFQRSGREYPADPGAVIGRDRFGVRDGIGGDGTVLLPGRSQALPRPQLLPGSELPVRRAWRLRASLRHRARGRAPRAEPRRRARD